MDQDNIIKIYARTDNRIQLKMIPGHFVTSQSHITHYLDLTTMKSRCAEAQRIASALAANYEASIPVDTIVCMDGLEVIGAYLAEELTKAGVLSMNHADDGVYRNRCFIICCESGCDTLRFGGSGFHGGEVQIMCDMRLGSYEMSRNHFQLNAAVTTCIDFNHFVLIHNKNLLS